jgi:hypothetical protein
LCKFIDFLKQINIFTFVSTAPIRMLAKVGAACPPTPPIPLLQKKDNWSPKKMPEILMQTNLQAINEEEQA